MASIEDRLTAVETYQAEAEVRLAEVEERVSQNMFAGKTMVGMLVDIDQKTEKRFREQYTMLTAQGQQIAVLTTRFDSLENVIQTNFKQLFAMIQPGDQPQEPDK
jgi:GTP-binding protein EngB required for normal cell division